MEQIGDHYTGTPGGIMCDAQFTSEEITELQTAINAKFMDDTNDLEQPHENIDKRLIKLLEYVQGTDVMVLTDQQIKDMHTACVARIHDLQRDSLEVPQVLLDLRTALLGHRNHMNPS